MKDITPESQQDHMFVVEDGKGRQAIKLDDPIYSIGRNPECDIHLFSHFVSRHHATLIRLQDEDGSYFYQISDGDLEGNSSTNGLLINGRKQQNRKLTDGDKIIFGADVRAVYYLVREDVVAQVSSEELCETLQANLWEEKAIVDTP
ncbi:MAG: FHA domain-containing protein [Cyanothece sp. SIO1E1]|nr:FHA domain-containing protein [Cyanothece sp. SIO1E1]